MKVCTTMTFKSAYDIMESTSLININNIYPNAGRK